MAGQSGSSLPLMMKDTLSMALILTRRMARAYDEFTSGDITKEKLLTAAKDGKLGTKPKAWRDLVDGERLSESEVVTKQSASGVLVVKSGRALSAGHTH
ncbi:hypothetical protein ACNKHR_15150 [Shigella flexneri]